MQDKTQTMLTEQDAALLEQGASMLESLENDERNRGNCSTAEGAGCSAHAVRRLAASLLEHERSIVQCLHQISEPATQPPCAWAISYDDGKTPYTLWHEGDGALLDTEIKRLGGSACKMPIYTIQPQAPAAPVSFQDRVQPWMLACFGAEIAGDKAERNHRFLEEALELVQACGCSASEAHQLVDYVFGRPVGEPEQEAGGTMVTLAALCLANGLDMHAAGETELARIWTKVEAIRAKQAAKPKHSPLPAAPAAPAVDALDATDRECLAIGRAINRAAGELPADGEIRIDIENGAGTVYVYEPQREDHRYIDSGDVFSAQINAAIDAAIQAAKGDKQK